MLAVVYCVYIITLYVFRILVPEMAIAQIKSIRKTYISNAPSF